MHHIVVSHTTIRTVALGVGALWFAATGTILVTRAQSAPAHTTAVPGASSDGTMLLPNGWRRAPAGKHLPLNTLPLNIVVSPDGRYALITTNGLMKPALSVVDIPSWTVKSTLTIDAAWYGLAFSPDGTKLYSAGAAQNNVQEFSFAPEGTLTRARTFALPAQSGDTFAGGLSVSRDGRMLYATRVFAMTLSAIDLGSGQVVKTVALPSEPYTSAVSSDGRLVFVSLWGGARVQVYQADSLSLLTEFPTDEHPNAMALSNDGRRLFVACANNASVWSFDTVSFAPIEQLAVTMSPDAPPSTTPNALSLSPDGNTLIVANADMNALAVVDVSNVSRGLVNGFIPTGWYPTGAVFTRDGRNILVLSGKGLAPA